MVIYYGSNKIKVNSANEVGVEITLGRYTFANSTPGNPTLAENSYQYASSYATPVTIHSQYQELTTVRTSNGRTDASGTRRGTNTTARGVSVNNSYNGIQGFIESVQDNKGYYVARYEASYRTNEKAGSIPSTSSAETLALESAPATRNERDLWNCVSQKDAAVACRDLYTTINSDLTNSYAWDTSIVYIQAMGNTNYANQNRGSNTTLMNTGDTGDEKCKIFDMAGNEIEYTTEYSMITISSYGYPCTIRGGAYFDDSAVTMVRSYVSAADTRCRFSFRSILYF